MHLGRKTGEGINHEVIVILSAEVRERITRDLVLFSEREKRV